MSRRPGGLAGRKKVGKPQDPLVSEHWGILLNTVSRNRSSHPRCRRIDAPAISS